MARIIDISDETKPFVVSKLGLETHDPKNCDKVLPDLVGISGFLSTARITAASIIRRTRRRSPAATSRMASGYSIFAIRPNRKRSPTTIPPRSPAESRLAKHARHGERSGRSLLSRRFAWT